MGTSRPVTGIAAVCPSTVSVDESFTAGVKLLCEPYVVGFDVTRKYNLSRRRNLSGDGTSDMHYLDNVPETWQGTLTIEVTVFDPNKPLALPATRKERRDLDPLDAQARPAGAERSASETNLEAAGRAWDAVVCEDRWTDEEIHYVRRTWVSAQAPVFGTIRMELYGDNILEARLELTAFGR